MSVRQQRCAPSNRVKGKKKVGRNLPFYPGTKASSRPIALNMKSPPRPLWAVALVALVRGERSIVDVPKGADLIVYGAGVLGKLVGQRWLEAQGESRGRVYAITRTMSSERAAEMRALGVAPCLSPTSCFTPPPTQPPLDAVPRCSFVVFSAPPPLPMTGDEDDYAAVIRDALSLWDRSDPNARFLFTSSTGVYDEDDGNPVDENSHVADSLRARRILNAEAEVQRVGGIVLRLSGLYLLDPPRGGHAAFMTPPEEMNEYIKGHMKKRGECSHPILPICRTRFSPFVTRHSAHLSHPIFPICHTPFFPFVTRHFAHLSHPICPFCRTRFSPCVTRHFAHLSHAALFSQATHTSTCSTTATPPPPS